MDQLMGELGKSFPTMEQCFRASTRLVAALIVGALIGYQRETVGKAAGLRTHMLVALGTSLFVIGALEFGMDGDDVSRVIQGLATGIGFLGAGAIMKIDEQKEIRGLTTAAGIWVTASASVAIGLGRIGLGLMAGIVSWLVLSAFRKLETKFVAGSDQKA